jgi:hypothetical protein
MHLVPVIQLEIEIARTRCYQILRTQSHVPESGMAPSGFC